MKQLNLFATYTGLHLAIMQFSYFFVLLINVTSTYVTYATIVIAWMVGTIAGLMIKRLPAGAALLAGVVSYYAVFAWVLVDPLAAYTLPLAAFGVAITGLWAGRFFMVMLPLFERADRLFFHENNGFLVGVIGVFVGFTLLGLAFLWWAPVVSALLLVLHMRWLHTRHRYAELRLFRNPSLSPQR